MISPESGAKLAILLLKEYFYKKGFRKDLLLKDLRNLQKRDLIEYKELEDGKIKIVLSKKGKNEVLQYDIDNIKLTNQKGWDGKWRLVMFDIPHNRKNARDAFRKKLIDLEFYPIQKSVFITPYPCEKEIEFISAVFEIRKYILILYVLKFEGDVKLKQYFKI